MCLVDHWGCAQYVGVSDVAGNMLQEDVRIMRNGRIKLSKIVLCKVV